MNNGLGRWLEDELYPRLYERLDEAFPEFAFVRRGRAWVATQWPSGFPFDVSERRPDRLNVYENTPFVITVHGHSGGVRILDYANGGRRVVGPEFIPVVKQLAQLVGIALPERQINDTEIQALRAEDVRREILEATLAVDQEALWSTLGADARTYFSTRGFTNEDLRELGLGLHHFAAVRGALAGKFDAEAIRNSGVLWERLDGYVVLPWLDSFGRALTLYGRWPAKTPPEGRPKTMALPGEGTKSAPLFFNRARQAGHRHLVAVEGLFDAAMAQLRGDDRVVAYVAAAFSHNQIETLRRFRTEAVTLVGDPDGGGDRGTKENVQNLLRAGIRPYVPPRLADGLDPDDFILRNGIESWRAHVERAVSGGVWMAQQILAEIGPDATDARKDEAVAQLVAFTKEHLTGDWAEQDLEAIADVAAERTGRKRRTLLRMLQQKARKAAKKRDAGGAGHHVTASVGKVEIHDSDTGNAQRLLAWHGGDLLYCWETGRWHVWDGCRFIEDAGAAIRGLAVKTVRRMYGEACEIEDPDVRARLAKWALKSEAAGRLAAMVDVARAIPEYPVSVTPDGLDRDGWLLNVLNGTLDLKTGELRPHDRGHRISRLAPVIWDPSATAPTWERVLGEVFDAKADRIAFFKRAVGYGLTGVTSEHVLFILIGDGRNGKSTVLLTLERVLGDYAHSTRPETFMVKSREVIPTDIADLRGRRFVISTEAAEGQRLNEPLVKQMTGGDTIPARRLFHDFFTFTPAFKVFLATNHKPEIRGADAAIWARIRLIPFEVSFKGREDRHLIDKLVIEAPGILRWSVEGCLEWQRDGLGEPDDVAAAGRDYRDEMDPVSDFLDDCCDVMPEGEASSSELYAVYAKWCARLRVYQLSKKGFAERLKQRGCEPTRTGTTRKWKGVHLLNEVFWPEFMQDKRAVETRPRGMTDDG